jgi:hypothetical protein|tara:strand:- start:7454 stop:7951 length:498 start_codon:yes stop_codon:yes gene_type:complete
MAQSKIKKFEKMPVDDTIALANSDINEFVKLASQVGHNTSKIEILEKKSQDLDGVKVEIAEIKVKQSSIDQRLKKLDDNDIKIESGISKFRYWLVGGFVGFCLLVCSAIWSSLSFGLKQYSKDKKELKSSLIKKINTVDSESKGRHIIVDQKLDKIMMHLMKESE